MQTKYFEFSVVPKNGSCGNVLLSNNQTRDSEQTLWTELEPDDFCDIDKVNLIYIKSSGKPR